MKRKLIEIRCNDLFDIEITKEMFDSVEEMFDKFVLGIESEGLEDDIELFFDKMYLDIECELESWD
jgi:hypothetical protein